MISLGLLCQQKYMITAILQRFDATLWIMIRALHLYGKIADLLCAYFCFL